MYCKINLTILVIFSLQLFVDAQSKNQEIKQIFELNKYIVEPLEFKPTTIVDDYIVPWEVEIKYDSLQLMKDFDKNLSFSFVKMNNGDALEIETQCNAENLGNSSIQIKLKRDSIFDKSGNRVQFADKIGYQFSFSFNPKTSIVSRRFEILNKNLRNKIIGDIGIDYYALSGYKNTPIEKSDSVFAFDNCRYKILEYDNNRLIFKEISQNNCEISEDNFLLLNKDLKKLLIEEKEPEKVETHSAGPVQLTITSSLKMSNLFQFPEKLVREEIIELDLKEYKKLVENTFGDPNKSLIYILKFEYEFDNLFLIEPIYKNIGTINQPIEEKRTN